MSVADIEPDIEEELELTRVEVTVPEGASPGSKLEVSVAAGNGEMYAGRGAVRAAPTKQCSTPPISLCVVKGWGTRLSCT